MGHRGKGMGVARGSRVVGRWARGSLPASLAWLGMSAVSSSQMFYLHISQRALTFPLPSGCPSGPGMASPLGSGQGKNREGGVRQTGVRRPTLPRSKTCHGQVASSPRDSVSPVNTGQ